MSFCECLCLFMCVCVCLALSMCLCDLFVVYCVMVHGLCVFLVVGLVNVCCVVVCGLLFFFCFCFFVCACVLLCLCVCVAFGLNVLVCCGCGSLCDVERFVCWCVCGVSVCVLCSMRLSVSCVI